MKEKHITRRLFISLETEKAWFLRSTQQGPYRKGHWFPKSKVNCIEDTISANDATGFSSYIFEIPEWLKL